MRRLSELFSKSKAGRAGSIVLLGRSGFYQATILLRATGSYTWNIAGQKASSLLIWCSVNWGEADFMRICPKMTTSTILVLSTVLPAIPTLGYAAAPQIK